MKSGVDAAGVLGHGMTVRIPVWILQTTCVIIGSVPVVLAFAYTGRTAAALAAAFSTGLFWYASRVRHLAMTPIVANGWIGALVYVVAAITTASLSFIGTFFAAVLAIALTR